MAPRRVVAKARTVAGGFRVRLALAFVVCATALAPGAAGAAGIGATGCPPPIREVLDGTPATQARTVALTFDDGPSPRWTPQVLDALRARGVHATFFVVGSNVDAYPDLSRRIVDEGHLLANHTYSHTNLDRLGPAKQAAEIDRGTAAIVAATGVRPCLFRGPEGAHHSSSVKQLAWERGLTIAGWTHDSRDYQAPPHTSPSFQIQIVQQATHPLAAQSTVLLHDGSDGNYRQNTVDSVDRIVSYYAGRGFAFTDPTGRPFPARLPDATSGETGGGFSAVLAVGGLLAIGAAALSRLRALPSRRAAGRAASRGALKRHLSAAAPIASHLPVRPHRATRRGHPRSRRLPE